MPSSDPEILAAKLRMAIVWASRRQRLERSSEAITDGQYGVLSALSRLGPLTPGALADIEHVQPPSVTRMVNCLVDAGLVTRSEHPTDGRAVVITITDAGEAEVVETRRRRNAWLAGRLAALTANERKSLDQAADLINQLVNE